MKHLVFHNGQKLGLDETIFTLIDIKSFFGKSPTSEIEKLLQVISSKDLLPYFLSQVIKNESVKSIILIHEGIEWYEVIRIGIYLRLFPDENRFSKLPIIFCSDKIPDYQQDRNLRYLSDISNYQYAEGLFYKSYFELFGIKKNEAGDDELGIDILLRETVGQKLFDGSDLEVNSINHGQDRHSITNQWGAVKLALNSGYSSQEINYDFPPTLYFNYLLKKFGSNILDTVNRGLIINELHSNNISADKINFSSKLGNKKVLLIDDNADNGWASTLKLIFSTVDVLTDYQKVNQFGNLLNLTSYGIIFLDLRLPRIQLQDIKPDYGFELLKSIKEKYPEIPVIIFTASNKSWTLEEVLELGADGMYVKESPENAGDIDYSKGNFKSFVKTISSALDKYNILRPFWEAIQNILKSQGFNTIQEKGSSKFKDRINERLEMFYGLLKRGFEQRKYNQDNFHFSDYELAFMTLWSVLNEISEAFYDKSQPSTSALDNLGNQIFQHPNGNNIIYLNNPQGANHFKWDILGQTDTFIEYLYRLKYDLVGSVIKNNSGYFYKLDSDQQSYFAYNNNSFSIIPLSKTKINFETTLYIQIEFLLEMKNNLKICANKLIFQQKLVALNEIRNHLYLTHGSLISTGFFNLTEKDKRNDPGYNINPENAIKDLFELITFLITGNEVQISF